jgi:hypothetical protein
MKNCLIIILVSICISVPGQNKGDCKKKIVNAENLFKQGLFKESEQSVRSALETCNLSSRNKLEAYEILSRINIESDDLDEAFVNLKKVIRLNPNYQPNPARVEEDFIKYFNKYRVTPVLSAGVFFEPVFPFFVTENKVPNSILGEFDYSGKYTAENLNSIYGLVVTGGLPTNTRLSLSAGMMNINFQRKVAHKSITGYYTQINERSGFFNLTLEAVQHYKFKKYSFYGGLGYTFSSLLSSDAVITARYPIFEYDTTNYVDLIQKGETFFTEKNSVEMRTLRQSLNFMKYTAGITYNVSSYIFDLKLSYNYGLNLFNSEKYYLPEFLVFRNYYIDNSFTFNSVSLNFSVSYIIFHHIRKLKQ